MRTNYFLFVLFMLGSSFGAIAQKATMYIPYQYAMEVDTSVWAVPYLIPHPQDYAERTQLQLLHKNSQQKLVVDLRSLTPQDVTNAPKSCLEIAKSAYFPYLISEETIVVEEAGFYAEICYNKSKVTHVLGYYRFNSIDVVIFNYRPSAAYEDHEAFCRLIGLMFQTIKVVGAKSLDEKAGLPLSRIKDLKTRRQFVLTSLHNRMRLHSYHNAFYLTPSEPTWMGYAKKTSIDTLSFDNAELTPYNIHFTFQRVEEELASIKSKTLSGKQAIEVYLAPSQHIHQAYFDMAQSRALASISEQVSLSLGKKVTLQNALTRVKHRDDLIYMKGETPTQSYLITAVRTKNNWQFDATLIGNLSEEQSKTPYSIGFSSRDKNQKADRYFVLKLPTPPTDQSFGFGFVNSYKKTNSANIASIPRRFVFKTNPATPKPLFFPNVNASGYDVVYEFISPLNNVATFMSHVFEGSSKIGDKNWRYSIHYTDEEKLLAARVNHYQKVGVDEPTRRAYLTPIYTTDYDRNNENETWYALISNGQIIETHGFQNTSKGLVPLQVSDSFKAKMKLELSIQDVMELSIQKQDPFQRDATEKRPMDQGLTNYRGREYDLYGSGENSEIYEDVIAPMAVMEEPVPDLSNSDGPLSFAQEMPVYPGGEEQMVIDIAQAIEYPAAEKEKGIGGKVFVQFIVERDGSVSNVKTVRGVSGGNNLSAAAEKAVMTLKKFNPAKQNGKEVRLTMIVPVTFKL